MRKWIKDKIEQKGSTSENLLYYDSDAKMRMSMQPPGLLTMSATAYAMTETFLPVIFSYT